MLANYRVPAELSAIETTEDGRAVVIATVDGCLTVLAIADPNKDSFLSALPSRDETVSVKSLLYILTVQFNNLYFSGKRKWINNEQQNYLKLLLLLLSFVFL